MNIFNDINEKLMNFILLFLFFFLLIFIFFLKTTNHRRNNKIKINMIIFLVDFLMGTSCSNVWPFNICLNSSRKSSLSDETKSNNEHISIHPSEQHTATVNRSYFKNCNYVQLI